jgi:hypothetical protein
MDRSEHESRGLANGKPVVDADDSGTGNLFTDETAANVYYIDWYGEWYVNPNYTAGVRCET